MTVNLRDFEGVKCALDDCQSALAAALARIEAFRIRERILAQEMAQLRLGNDPGSATASPGGAAAPEAASEPAASPEGRCEAEPPSNGADVPAYITHLRDHCPVVLISGGLRVRGRARVALRALHRCPCTPQTARCTRVPAWHPQSQTPSDALQTPGSVVVTEDFIDFVEVRARIRREDYVGISTASTASPTRTRPVRDGGGGTGRGLWRRITALQVPVSPLGVQWGGRWASLWLTRPRLGGAWRLAGWQPAARSRRGAARLEAAAAQLPQPRAHGPAAGRRAGTGRRGAAGGQQQRRSRRGGARRRCSGSGRAARLPWRSGVQRAAGRQLRPAGTPQPSSAPA
jgi:hypothetical protein